MELTVFDQILYQFETIATGGIPQVRGLVMATFWLLATIDACMAFLTNLEDGNHFKILIQKCLKIGFWLFMVNEWGTFCDVILNGFIQVGSVIGSGASFTLMQHPSQVVGQGLVTLKPILDYESKMTTGWMEVMAHFPILMAGILSYLIGCLAYIILAIQIVLTYVEFFLVCALFTLFVPFGVTRWTSFLAEKAIGGVIAYGVKLMVLAAIVSIIPDEFSGGGASSYDGGSSSNASSGSDGSAAPPAADTSGSSSSSPSTASKAKSAGAGAVAGAAAGSAGAAVGTAAAGSAGGAAGGVVGSVAGDAAGSAAYDSASSSDAKSSSGSPASPSGAPPSQPSGNSQAPTQANPQNQQQKQPAFSNALSGAMLIKNSIPSEAGPHGSMNAPIRD